MARIFISYKRVDKDKVFKIQGKIDDAHNSPILKFRPREYALISIKPYNIQPYATPPEDMIEHYHFEEL